MCLRFDDPATLTPAERRHEIAAILARGILRLSTCAQSSQVSPESRAHQDSAESGENCLDLSAPSSPHGCAG
jgi:hypothetical protein